jgi:hypothetical protein
MKRVESQANVFNPAPAALLSHDPLRPRHVWLLLGIVLIAACCRWGWIGHQDYWYDEFWSMATAMGHCGVIHHLPTGQMIAPPLDVTTLRHARAAWSIWTGMQYDVHPPLHFFLLRLWCDGFGDHLAAARAFSAVMSLLAIVVFFDVLRQLHGTTAGLWGALLMALAATQIVNADEARSYATMELTALLAADILIRLERRGASRGRVIAFGAALLAMMLTHYYLTFVALALGVYACLRLRGRTRRLTLGAAAAAVLVYLALWGPTLAAQLANHTGISYWLQDSSAHPHRADLLRLLCLPMMAFSIPKANSIGFAALGGVLYLFPLLLLRRRPDLLLWVLWLPAMVLPLGLSDWHSRTMLLGVSRYTLLATLPIYALIAACLIHQPRGLRHLLPAIAALACLPALPGLISADIPPNASWNALGEYLNQRVQPGDALVFAAHTQGDPGLHYLLAGKCLGASYYLRGLHGPFVLLEAPATPAVLQRLRAAPRRWAVTDDPDHLSQWLPGLIAAKTDRRRIFGVGYAVRLEKQRRGPAKR